MIHPQTNSLFWLDKISLVLVDGVLPLRIALPTLATILFGPTVSVSGGIYPIRFRGKKNLEKCPYI